MTYIILKKTGNFPKAWEKVTTLKHLYYNNGFLKEEYGLKDDEKIYVRHTKTVTKNINKNIKKGYRTKIRKVFYGTVDEFNEYCRKKFRKKKTTTYDTT